MYGERKKKMDETRRGVMQIRVRSRREDVEQERQQISRRSKSGEVGKGGQQQSSGSSTAGAAEQQ